METLGAFAQFVNAGVIAGIVVIATLLVQLFKLKAPALQGRVTLITVFCVAFALSLVAQVALWQIGQEEAIWTAAGALGVVLNAFLGGCGALGLDTTKNAAMGRAV